MWWQVLGVERDADQITIKRAYSQLIRQYRPDEHPEQFSAIRAAYEAGRAAQPRTTAAVPELAEFNVRTEPPSQVTSPSAHPLAWPADEPGTDVVETTPDPIPELLSWLQQWRSGDYRDSTVIDRILAHPALNEYKHFQRIDLALFDWLGRHIAVKKVPFAVSANMPHKQLARLDQVFRWSEREVEMYRTIPDRDHSLLMFALCDGQPKSQTSRPKPIASRQESTSFFANVLFWGYLSLSLMITLNIRPYWLGAALLAAGFLEWRINYMRFSRRLARKLTGLIGLARSGRTVIFTKALASWLWIACMIGAISWLGHRIFTDERPSPLAVLALLLVSLRLARHVLRLIHWVVARLKARRQQRKRFEQDR